MALGAEARGRREPTGRRSRCRSAGLVEIAVFNRKANLGPIRPPFGLRLTFGQDRTSVHTLDVATVEDFAAKLPLWQRVRSALRGGPMTYAELATALDAKVDSVEKTVKRDMLRGDRRTFARLDGKDGVARVALLDRAERGAA